MIAITSPLDCANSPQRQRRGIYARSSFRDAQLPAGLCADRFGGATTAVTGYTKNSFRGVANSVIKRSTSTKMVAAWKR